MTRQDQPIQTDKHTSGHNPANDRRPPQRPVPAPPAETLAKINPWPLPDLPWPHPYLDKGLTGASRARPGLDQALAAVREGDTLTVTKLDRLARSVPDALDILGQLSARGGRFALGGSVYDWNDPFARMFLQILAVIAEFEANLIRQRTREGMDIAHQNGKLKVNCFVGEVQRNFDVARS